MNLLMIVTAFAPENEIGSIRTTKLAKYLVRDGHQVTVITKSLEPGVLLDPLLESPEINAIRRFNAPYSPFFRRFLLSGRNSAVKANQGSQFVKNSRKARISQSLVFLYTIIKNLDWYLSTRKVIRKELKGEGFDIVLSSYPSLGSLWAAGYARRKGKAKRWAADFRDPIVYEWQSRFQQAVNRRIQNSAERRADLVTVVTKGAMPKFAISGERGKLRWLPNGFDPDDMKELLADSLPESREFAGEGRLTLSYAGGLYGGKRDLSVLFKALKELVDEGAMRKEDLVFLYAGSDAPVLMEAARPFGLEDVISSQGRVNRQKALSMQKASDVVVICTHNSASDQGVIPGKLYEGFLLEKSTLGIVNGDLPGSELKAMVEAVRAGFVYEQASHDTDFPALKAFLLSAGCEKKAAGQVRSGMDGEQKALFQYDQIASRLLSMLGGGRGQEQ